MPARGGRSVGDSLASAIIDVMTAKKTKLIEHRMGAGGESVYIAGTRVRVHDIVREIDFVEEDDVIHGILQALPHLTAEQVHAAIEYWLTHKREIDEHIRREDELAAETPLRA